MFYNLTGPYYSISGLFAATLVFFLGLCWISWIDLKSFRLPNSLNYALLAFGLIQAYILLGEIKLHVLGAALGYGVFVAIEVAFKALRNKDGLGRGDAKLLAVAGAWCGAYALPMIVAIASLSAIAIILVMQKDSSERIPFGPFLSFSMFSVWVFANLYPVV